MPATDKFNTVYEAFSATAATTPDAAFFCVPPMAGRDYFPDGADFTYGETLTAVDAMKDRYAAAGYGHGHRVALLLENRPEFFHHYLALNALGIGIVPVNPDYTRDELAYQLEHSEAALVVAISNRVTDCDAAASDTSGPAPVIDVYNLPGTLPNARGETRDGAPGLMSEAALLYTSGTTGRPKGCVLSNFYMINAGDGFTSIGGTAVMHQGVERHYNPLPLFHMNALAVTATGVMLKGNCLISPDRFHPSAWWDDLRATWATIFSYLGVVPPLLLNEPPSPSDKDHGIRFGFGAGVDPKHHAAFEDRFGIPLVEGWGMTETGRIFADVHEPRQVGTRAFGKPTETFEARVVDDRGNDVPPDTDGELWVRHSDAEPKLGLFSEYLKDPKATEEAWAGGWFHTGDTVRQGADGMLFFVDRKKNIIRRAGENIAAAEVEAVLQSHGDVAQAAVLSVPDEVREEEVYACIAPMTGVEAGETLANQLMDWCLERLAYFKAPGYFYFTDSLPSTGTQKIQKQQIFAAEEDPRTAKGVFDLTAQKRRAK
ncbi:MAG: AMP-binding protein [Alphaproteobacteria bacterium]|jgi:crotonobetaine/carnitine-CoA ligase|nr:AMP-binding protein [Alphaproteobacteria bacterium]